MHADYHGYASHIVCGKILYVNLMIHRAGIGSLLWSFISSLQLLNRATLTCRIDHPVYPWVHRRLSTSAHCLRYAHNMHSIASSIIFIYRNLIKMNDIACFNTFLTAAGLTQARQRSAFMDNFCQTFTELSQANEKEIDQFVKRNDEMNRTRGNNHQETFVVRFLKNLKAVLIELQDRAKCLAPSDEVMLNGIDANALHSMRLSYSEYIRDNRQCSKQILPDKTVCKLSSKSWGIFKMDVQEVLSRILGVNYAPLAHVIRKNDHNAYDDHHESRIDKLVACIAHQGNAFKEDPQKVWSLLSQHVGEVLEGKTICDRYHRSKDGRQTWHDLLLHFNSTAYKSNLATNAESKIKNAHYSGERGNFTMTSYYAAMSVAFNDLEEAARGLSER